MPESHSEAQCFYGPLKASMLSSGHSGNLYLAMVIPQKHSVVKPYIRAKHLFGMQEYQIQSQASPVQDFQLAFQVILTTINFGEPVPVITDGRVQDGPIELN